MSPASQPKTNAQQRTEFINVPTYLYVANKCNYTYNFNFLTAAVPPVVIIVFCEKWDMWAGACLPGKYQEYHSKNSALPISITETFLKIYKTYIRPLMEYLCISVWNAYFAKDVEHLEGVQRSATKLPSCCHPACIGEAMEIDYSSCKNSVARVISLRPKKLFYFR